MTNYETAETPRFLDVLRGTPLEECLNFWRRRRQAREVPRKSAIDPVEMPRHILPNLFIYQQMGDGRFRCRLAGTEICRVNRLNPTGHYLDSLIAPVVMQSRLGLFLRVLEDGTPVVYGGRMLYSERRSVRFRRLLLPISAAGDRADHIFGMVIYSDFEPVAENDRLPQDGPPDLVAWATEEELDDADASEARHAVSGSYSMTVPPSTAMVWPVTKPA